MLVSVCNLKPMLDYGSIEYPAGRFCETIPREAPGRPVSRILL
jgi:hypothetical protein